MGKIELQKSEVHSYLTAPNVVRYRAIMRILYEGHQNIDGSLNVGVIMSRIIDSFEVGDDFTEDDCKNYLKTLKDNGNVETEQENIHARSIDAFINSKYKYRISEVGIKVERNILEIESDSTKSAAIHQDDLTEFVALIKDFERINSLAVSENVGDILRWWEKLSGMFRTISEKSADVTALYEERVNEFISDRDAFFIYIDKVIDIIHNYVYVLTKSQSEIVREIAQMEPCFENLSIKIAAANTEYVSLQKDNDEDDGDKIRINILSQLKNMDKWFQGKEKYGIARVSSAGMTLINKLVECISRKANLFERDYNRREEILHMVNLFAGANDVDEAHCMFAYIFGAAEMRHLKVNTGLFPASFNPVFNEKPHVYYYDRRRRDIYKKKDQIMIIDKEGERLKQEEAIRQYEKIRFELTSHFKDGKLDTLNIEYMSHDALNEYVDIITKTKPGGGILTNKYGFNYQIEAVEEETRCIILSDHGQLDMPRVIVEVDL